MSLMDVLIRTAEDLELDCVDDLKKIKEDSMRHIQTPEGWWIISDREKAIYNEGLDNAIDKLNKLLEEKYNDHGVTVGLRLAVTEINKLKLQRSK
jgi:hypothetical protein